MTLESPENLAKIIRSEVEAWTAELVVLRRDPAVKKFLEVQDRIDHADAFMVEADAPALSAPSWPFDLYDAFEFSRDLSGKQLTTQALSRLAQGRFPTMSVAGHEVMMNFLVDNGFAEVGRRTASGQPASYRFVPPGNGGTDGDRKRFGLPANELSGLKADDLEDVIGLPRGDLERS